MFSQLLSNSIVRQYGKRAAAMTTSTTRITGSSSPSSSSYQSALQFHHPSQDQQRLQRQRQFGTTADMGSVKEAWDSSCYNKIDYCVTDDSTVFDAVQKFAAYDIGALVVTDSSGCLSGLISERDYIKKIALLGKTSKTTKIKDVFTSSANLVTATTDDSIDACMQKMMTKSIRHLPILDTDGKKVVGMVSIKDLIKIVFQDKEKTIRALSDFALGKSSASV
jgi:CBS domain-containing protein